MTIKGIDLASHQGPAFPFAKAKEQGFEFAIIKATGGHSYRNPYLGQQVAAARANGFALGYYHYMFEPTSGGGNMAMEYANFRDTVRSTWREGDSLWLDVEEYPQAVNFTGNLGDWIVDWCSRAEADFGVVPGIYCATWYLQPTGLNADERLRKYPFWCASWQADPPRGSFLAPWDTITVWQYDAHYTGVTGSHLDCNQFFGTREQFLALGTPKKKVAEVIKDTLPRADGFMEEVEVHFKNPTDPGKGIPYKITVWVYNPDEGKHYSDTWELGEYAPWVRLD